MICIVKLVQGKIEGWIIASDVHEARRRAMAAGHHDLASTLYGIEFPRPGKTELPGGYTMLVD